VKKHIRVLFHLAAPKTRSSACSIDQALACLIDAGTSMCRTHAGDANPVWYRAVAKSSRAAPEFGSRAAYRRTLTRPAKVVLHCGIAGTREGTAPAAYRASFQRPSSTRNDDGF
jgi:hypothetical protein